MFLTRPVSLASPEPWPSVGITRNGLGGKGSMLDSPTDSGSANVGRKDEPEVRSVLSLARCGAYGPLRGSDFLSRLSAKVVTHPGTKHWRSGRMTGKHAQTKPMAISTRDHIPAGWLVSDSY